MILDDLAVRIENKFEEMDGLVNSLIDLCKRRQFYKRLHLNIHGNNLSSDQLIALHGLTTLYTLFEHITKYPVLNGIKEFGVNGSSSTTFRTSEWVSRFMNLEQLRIFRADFDAILPFIRHSKKIISIVVWKYEGETVNISALNKERESLAVRGRVTIYVAEHTYLATKWASKETKYDFIELERHDSFATKRPHGFWDCYRPYDF